MLRPFAHPFACCCVLLGVVAESLKPFKLSATYNRTQQLATLLHSKSERSVLAIKMGPFWWVKYSPIFESNLAPLNQGQHSQLTRADLVPGAEMGPRVGWNSLLIEFFGLNCAQMAPGRDELDFGLQSWIDALGLKRIFLIFSVGNNVGSCCVRLYIA